jgi:hypothetical protein
MPDPEYDVELKNVMAQWATALPLWAGPPLIFAAWDAQMRLSHYEPRLQALTEDILKGQSLAKFPDHVFIAQKFFDGRNKLLDETRQFLTPVGRALSEATKAAAPEYDATRTQRAAKLIQPVDSLAVSESIIGSAPRANQTVTSGAKAARVFGVTFAVLAGGTMALQLFKAKDEDRLAEMFRMSSEVVGGGIGTLVGVPAMWAACKLVVPKVTHRPAIVLHIMFNLVGAAAGSALLSALASKVAPPQT